MPTVNVASRLDTAFLLRDAQGATHTIVNTRHPNAVDGWGLSYDVDADAFAAWQQANPDLADLVRPATQEQIDTASDPANTHGYELGLSDADQPPTEPPVTAPPVNVTVPYIELNAGVLNCTMGTWEGDPTSYAYQWHMDAAYVGTGDPTYTVQPGDSGKTATCIVTATNAAGSTVAPPSNAIVV